MLGEQYEFILTVYNNKNITAKTRPHRFNTRKDLTGKIVLKMFLEMFENLPMCDPKLVISRQT